MYPKYAEGSGGVLVEAVSMGGADDWKVWAEAAVDKYQLPVEGGERWRQAT